VLRDEGLAWLIGAVVCLLAANHGSNCSHKRAIDGRMLRCGIISSCQSAAIFEIVKAILVLSPSRVRSAIASAGLFYIKNLTYGKYYLFLNLKNLLCAVRYPNNE